MDRLPTQNHRGDIFQPDEYKYDMNNKVVGAPSPDMTLSSINMGLTREHLEVNDGIGFTSGAMAYAFTERLVTFIGEIFGEQQSQGLFLCELGSQRAGEAIDDAFTSREHAMRTGRHHTPPDKQDVAFVDTKQRST